MAIPWMIPSDAMVATIGLICRPSINRVLKPPMAMTAANRSSTVSTTDFGAMSGRVTDIRTTARLIVEPTEMSINPPIIANCCPRATNASGRVSTRRVVRLNGDQKTSVFEPV